jgi:hypothetical protein
MGKSFAENIKTQGSSQVVTGVHVTLSAFAPFSGAAHRELSAKAPVSSLGTNGPYLA